ncbi:hypothetical protein Tco_0641858 [Tanacetum coccineum]
MDDLNITMEEYIRLEEEKARRRAIVFNDTLTSKAALSCEPTVSSLNNNEIDFRISFDESDDDDCTPTVSYFDDSDYFKYFKKEFPAIVYNDAQTSKLDFLTEPTMAKTGEKNSALVGEVKYQCNDVMHYPRWLLLPKTKNNTTIRYEKKMKFVEQPIRPAPDLETADPDTIEKYYETVNLEQEVACLMLSSMSPDLQRTL